MDRSVSCYSKDILPGGVFVAIRGGTSNCEDYIAEAIEKGAKTIVLEKGSFIEEKVGIKYQYVKNARHEFARLVHKVYNKQLPENLVAITGTNGKTSVGCFFTQIVHLLGEKSAGIGSLGLISDDMKPMNTKLTTPDSLTLHQLLFDCYNNGINYCAIEASSQGIEQSRMDYIPCKVAAFTNFTHEHLDYHKTLDNYLRSKLKMLAMINEGGHIILHSSLLKLELVAEFLKKNLTRKRIVYGQGKDVNVSLISEKREEITLSVFGKICKTTFSVPGDFQKENLLAAICISSIFFDVNKIMDVIPKLSPVKRRMERVDNNFNIYLDYAHTPAALEAALRSVQKINEGELYLIFGCGGNRDERKRSIMGKIAERYANHIYITDDNPRKEDPAKIRANILSGMKRGIEISDRVEAIRRAISKMDKKDTLLIAVPDSRSREVFSVINRILL